MDAKQFSSGWHHYLLYGFRENRLGVNTDVHQIVDALFNSEGSEIHPPENLRTRVHGEGRLESFESVGRMISLDIQTVLENRITIDSS